MIKNEQQYQNSLEMTPFQGNASIASPTFPRCTAIAFSTASPSKCCGAFKLLARKVLICWTISR
ncbi:hypothetical protein LC593_33440 [Nostoc sp. CHAB 5844]|nr:hypothetical protein [Nostoc sp. CHAB 5844]